jgi:hypothetical protein
MNKGRRKVLYHILDELEKLRGEISTSEACKILNQAGLDLERIADDEDWSLNNRPESFQWSAANDDMLENISDLNDAYADMETAEECVRQSKKYSYDLIKEDVVRAVNAVKGVIHR